MTQLLPDIERGKTWGTNWLKTCLCRWLMRQSKDARQAFYRAWERRHGKAAAQKLASDVKAEWAKSGGLSA